MRKRTVKYAADTIFWYILYFLPVIAFLISMFSIFQNEGLFSYTEGISDIFRSIYYNLRYELFYIPESSIIYQSLYNIFCNEEILYLFDGSMDDAIPIIHFVTYFISVYLIHLAVDFILFIPRLAHKWMNAFTRGDE